MNKMNNLNDTEVQTIVLNAQIEVLKDLPYNTDYMHGEKYSKSYVDYSHVLRILNRKRNELNKLLARSKGSLSEV